MKSIRHHDTDKGRLYLIPTPIGNLDDITFRAVKMLKTVDALYAEDTRVSGRLLKHFDIDRSLISLHEHNEGERKNEILRLLDDGKHAGIISDAGTPLLSDPGFVIAKAAIDDDHAVIALPGANAVTPALSMSGLPPYPYMFTGFLPAKQKARERTLRNLRHVRATLVFYESPHKMQKTLGDLEAVLGNREASMIREISKRYEESIHGDLQSLQKYDNFRGEFVLVVAGASKTKDTVDVDVVKQVDYFIASGDRKTAAMKKVAEMTGIPKNKIYKTYIEKKLK